MPLAETLPYGLRDVKLKSYTSATALSATPIDLPNSRTFSFEEAEEFQELRGDDQVVATRGSGPSISWDLEAGGISLEAYQTINGGVVTSTGTTPAQVKTYKKASTDSRPEFQVEGQAISESGGDFHVILYRCKATGSLSGELADGAFWLTSASGSALPSRVTATLGLLYSFVQNETAAAIT
jgi:hypothetical protein